MPSLPKPEKPAPAPRRRIAPKCADCSCRERSHYGKTEVDPPGCAACGTCSGYVPHVPARSSVLRSPVARKKSGDKMGALGGLWPRCECKHGIAKHPGDRERLIGGPCKSCGCDRYRPRARKSAPARTKRPRKQRKTPLAKLKRQLWAAFAGYVKARDGNVCFVCGATGLEGSNWHAGHLFNSGNNSVIRYHPLNVHSNCGRCNVWLRGNIAVYAVRFLDVYGVAQLQALDAKRGVAKAWKRTDIEPMLAALERGGADYETFYAETYGL